MYRQNSAIWLRKSASLLAGSRRPFRPSGSPGPSCSRSMATVSCWTIRRCRYRFARAEERATLDTASVEDLGYRGRWPAPEVGHPLARTANRMSMGHCPFRWATSRSKCSDRCEMPASLGSPTVSSARTNVLNRLCSSVRCRLDLIKPRPWLGEIFRTICACFPVGARCRPAPAKAVMQIATDLDPLLHRGSVAEAPGQDQLLNNPRSLSATSRPQPPGRASAAADRQRTAAPGCRRLEGHRNKGVKVIGIAKGLVDRRFRSRPFIESPGPLVDADRAVECTGA